MVEEKHRLTSRRSGRGYHCGLWSNPARYRGCGRRGQAWAAAPLISAVGRQKRTEHSRDRLSNYQTKSENR